MTFIYLTYFALSFTVLLALVGMIMKIGAAMGNCPQTTGAAKSASITIATGYLTIGAGGVFLIAVALPLISNAPATALLLSLGLMCMALGMGFSNAVATLRVVAQTTLKPASSV